jgi:hypothetical protein
MYSLRQLRIALSRPKLFPRELNESYFSLSYGREYNRAGVDISDEDWDNLILLDACRYDAFETACAGHDALGDLERRISMRAATREFLRGNVRGRELHDTVYVTASPHYYINDDNRGEFHYVIHVWE